MYIVMVASECAPVAKVGGLGDVVSGLSRELEIRGNAVEIILPKYDCMRYDHIWGLQVTWEDLVVPWGGGEVRCTVWFGMVHGRKCYFIEPRSREHFFGRGHYYGSWDDPARFGLFSKAALEFMLRAGKRPDVIHTHDWQTGILPVLLYEIYARLGMGDQRAVHTIHNFRHQGVADEQVIRDAGLGHRLDHLMSRERLADEHRPYAANLTKGAIVFANFVTTVSPHHAWEARFTDQGEGLGHVLHRYQSKFGGLLNGLDYEMWNPETDPHIPAHFSAEAVLGKYEDKDALRRRFFLRDALKPIIAYVGRLDWQKGVPLIRHALLYAIWHGAQFVLLGSSPDRGLNEELSELRRSLNDNPDCHIELGYDEELAHLIYAGSDMFVVPSNYEPCGLTQMIALRYGTVPVVRAVGGLADTVFDVDHSDRPVEERNGYVFDHADVSGIESALSRAIHKWYAEPEAWRELARTGMRRDYSWNEPGRRYLDIYEMVRHK